MINQLRHLLNNSIIVSAEGNIDVSQNYVCLGVGILALPKKTPFLFIYGDSCTDRKGNPAVITFVNDAIEDFIASGEMDLNRELFIKVFDYVSTQIFVLPIEDFLNIVSEFDPLVNHLTLHGIFNGRPSLVSFKKELTNIIALLKDSQFIGGDVFVDVYTDFYDHSFDFYIIELLNNNPTNKFSYIVLTNNESTLIKSVDKALQITQNMGIVSSKPIVHKFKLNGKVLTDNFKYFPNDVKRFFSREL